MGNWLFGKEKTEVDPDGPWVVVFRLKGGCRGINGWQEFGPWVMTEGSRYGSEELAREAAQRVEDRDAAMGRVGTEWSYATLAEARANGMDRSRPVRTVERWRR